MKDGYISAICGFFLSSCRQIYPVWFMLSVSEISALDRMIDRHQTDCIQKTRDWLSSCPMTMRIRNWHLVNSFNHYKHCPIELLIYRIIVNLVEDTCFIVETGRSRQDKTCIETKFTIILYIGDFYWTMPVMIKTIHKC